MLDQALERLGLPSPTPPPVAGLLRQYEKGTTAHDQHPLKAPTAVCVILATYIWGMYVLSFLPGFLYRMGRWMASGIAAEFWRVVDLPWEDQFIHFIGFLSGTLFASFMVLIFVFSLTIALFSPAFFAYRFWYDRYPDALTFTSKDLPANLIRRSALAHQVTQAIIDLEKAHTSGDPVAIRKAVTLAVSDMERHILDAYRRRNIAVPDRRTAEIREHGRLVADRLRIAELTTDTDPSKATREVAALLLTIAHQYAEGRVGSLLDHPVAKEEELARIQRIKRSQGILRFALFILLTVSGIWGVTLTDMPEEAAGIVVAGIIVIAAALTRARIPKRAQDLAGTFAP